jgi:hypothetical protein
VADRAPRQEQSSIPKVEEAQGKTPKEYEAEGRSLVWRLKCKHSPYSLIVVMEQMSSVKCDPYRYERRRATSTASRAKTTASIVSSEFVSAQIVMIDWGK